MVDVLGAHALKDKNEGKVKCTIKGKNECKVKCTLKGMRSYAVENQNTSQANPMVYVLGAHALKSKNTAFDCEVHSSNLLSIDVT